MSSEAWHIAIALLLVLINAFFVASEMALVRARPTRFRTLAEQGNRAAERTLGLLGNLPRYLSTVQFGVTLTSLGIGWLGEPAFAAAIQRSLEAVFPAQRGFTALAHTLAIVIGFAIITILHLVIGELVPKNLGLQRTESVAMAVSGPMRAIYVVSYPAVSAINWMSCCAGTRPQRVHRAFSGKICNPQFSQYISASVLPVRTPHPFGNASGRKRKFLLV